jgi:predicted RND superfamily exporter protein
MKSLLERYARWCAKHPWTVLAATVLVCAGGLLLAMRLRISADLAAVLPENASSVQHLELAAKRLGSTDALYVSVQSPDKLANRRYLDDAAAVIERWPERPMILYKLDIRYFKDRRLLYADLSDMELVRDNLARRIRWEKVHNNPAFIDLEDEAAPEILPLGLEDKYAERYKDELGTTFSKGTEAEVQGRGQLQDSDYFYLERQVDVAAKDGTKRTEFVNAMMVRFRGVSVNVDVAQNFVYRAECLVGTRTGDDCRDVDRWPGATELPPEASIVLKVADYDPQMRSEIGGGIRQRVIETASLYQDVRASAIGSLVSMTLIVLLSFRRIRALLYVMVPLLVGILMCLAAATLLVGKLNVISAFTFAVLVGLGIDFGIHLGKRYEEERQSGLDNEDAIVRAFGSTGKAMALAMITTVLAFGTLISSEFRGFSDFGELCAIGVTVSMLAAYVLFPAVVTLADRFRPMKLRGGRASLPPTVQRFASRAIGWVIVVAIGIATIAALLASEFIRFEYKYGNLGTKRAVGGRINTNAAIRGYTGSPSVGFADTPEAAEAAHRYLKRRYTGENGPLKDVFTIFSFVPAQQARKIQVLHQIDLLMDDPSFGFFEDKLSDADLDRLDEWRGYLRVGGVDPLGPGFPQWAKDLFTELLQQKEIPQDATPAERAAIETENAAQRPAVGRILYLMPRRSLSDGLEAMRLQEQFETIRLPSGERIPVAASGFIFADIIRNIQRDGRFVTGIALIAVFVVLFATYRSLSRAFVIILPLLVGLSWLLGLLVLLDIPLTFYSMVMFPVIIGTGIDASVHLYQRYRELGPGSILTVLRRTGPPVILSAVTTMAGFGSLMFTQHRGLASMGQVAALGMSTVLVATLSGLPALILATERPRKAQPETPASPSDGEPPPRGRRRSWPFRPSP